MDVTAIAGVVLEILLTVVLTAAAATWARRLRNQIDAVHDEVIALRKTTHKTAEAAHATLTAVTAPKAAGPADLPQRVAELEREHAEAKAMRKAVEDFERRRAAADPRGGPQRMDRAAYRGDQV